MPGVGGCARTVALARATQRSPPGSPCLLIAGGGSGAGFAAGAGGPDPNAVGADGACGRRRCGRRPRPRAPGLDRRRRRARARRDVAQFCSASRWEPPPHGSRRTGPVAASGPLRPARARSRRPRLRRSAPSTSRRRSVTRTPCSSGSSTHSKCDSRTASARGSRRRFAGSAQARRRPLGRQRLAAAPRARPRTALSRGTGSCSPARST